jgi:hypothetical protein
MAGMPKPKRSLGVVRRWSASTTNRPVISRVVVDEREELPIPQSEASKGRGDPPRSCSPFYIRLVQIGNRKTGDVWAEAFSSQRSLRKLGEVTATWNQDESALDVYGAFVGESSCGVGARLYEALAREACKYDSDLRSDLVENMSGYSKSLWRKQVAKDRARWSERATRWRNDPCEVNFEGPRPRRKR